MKRIQISESHECTFAPSGTDDARVLVRELRDVGRLLVKYAESINALIRDGWDVTGCVIYHKLGFRFSATKEFPSKRDARNRLSELGLDAQDFDLKVLRQ
ncbi:MAG: hypothetical protein HQ581_27165 [Planctomycetes bacterium]|nr:hypothetical protein [Planctomycetota bacterium]